jgi:hypothetical protein
MKEYAMLVHTCSRPPNGSSSSAEVQGQMFAERLGASAEGLSLGLESFSGGGWQVLSHHVLETDGFLVVSFLIFRQQPRNL